MGDAIIPNASSYLQLYSDANERPSREWQLECKDAAMTFKDSFDRPWKFKASSYKFQDRAGLNEIDLRVKIETGDSERSANATAASVADGKAVAEAVRAAAAEAANAANIAAEINARGVAEAALAGADTTNAATAAAATVTEAAARAAADSALTVAVAAEETRATAAEAANALAISNILGASPVILDSLTELVTAYTNMDQDQQDLIVALTADVSEMREQLDQLLNL